MPQEHRIVNGRLVLVGSQRSSDLRPTPQPAGARPRPPRSGGSGRPSRPPKPWWQQVLNHAEYEVFGRPFQNPLVRYNPVAQLVRRNWQTQKFLLNQAALGVVGAGDNAARSGYEYVQRVSGRPRGDASSGRLGADLDRNVDRLYTMLGATPPSQMTPQEREFDQNRRSIALNVLLAPATPSLGAANAATGLGMLVRGAGAFGLNEALSTFLDDNRGGNPINLINQLTGARLPGAVDVGKDDRLDAAIKSLAPNATASLAFGTALGGGVALSARGIDAFRNIRRNIQADRAIAAELRHRARQRDLGLLEEDEAGGLDFTPDAQQPPAPASAPAATQAPDPRTPAQQTLDANAAMEQRLGMRPEAAPAAPEPKPIPTSEFQDPTQPGADMGAVYEPGQERPWDYDPSLPESTALGKSVEDLSDSEIQAVLSSPGTPVVERVNQAIEARAGVEPRPGMDAAMVMAPTGRLADDYISSVMRKLDAREPYELRSLFDPQVNPGLWQRAQALTGVDDVSQLSKIDMLDAISASAADGQTPIVNRLMGGQMLPTGEIAAAPKVFQYKGNVNAAGEQLGNSLEGVERWDPNAENIIQVWRDANGEIGNPGQVYVVNGHNRLAAANRLGIPSMRIEYLDAPTAAEARLQGAIANVSDGKGTVFDAAKLAREYGITDPAQLKAMGKPGASGFWKDGIALGKLPEDVFTAAVNGQLGETTRKAVIIGESGVDPETMRSAYRYLVQQGPDSVKEATLREMLAMAGRSPAASSADQPDLLTGTEWGQSFNEGLLAKANLAGTVRLMLSKEKKLFGTVGRQAGQIERVGQVDAAAAKDISGEASRALTIFDQLKYEAGPVGDLLNEGTQRILAGESADQVAKGIKNRLAAAISEAMGKEVAPAIDVVQEDMFAAAGRGADQPPAPVELSPEQRNAAEAQLLHEAIAGGEVRPPSAPIPDLPAPAQVRLDEAMDEPLETRGQGRFFHGAANEFTLEPGGEFGGDAMNIYGDGLYVTDDLLTATRYRKKNARRDSASGEGVVYEVTERKPVKLLDIDQPASIDVLKALKGGSSYDAEWIETAIYEAGDGASIASIMDEMRGWSREFDRPVYEVQETFQSFFDRLESLGYGGLTHEGGHMAGGGKRLHQVRIYWNPAETVEINRINPYNAPITPGSKAAQALADEARLALEHARMDAAMQQVQEQAAKDGMGYEHLAFDQKKEAGALGGGVGLDKPAAPAPAAQVEIPPTAGKRITPKTSQNAINSAAESLASWTRLPGKAPMSFKEALGHVQAKGARLDPDAVPSLNMDAARNEAAMGMSTPNTEAVARAYRQFYGLPEPAPTALTPAPVRPRPLQLMQPASQPELLLPQDLRRAAPRYGRNTIAFQSDLDRAAYVLANDAVKPSKAAAKFRQVVQEAGLSLDEVVAHGKRVKAALKQAAKGTTGEIDLPAQPWRGGGPAPAALAGDAEMAVDGWGSFDGTSVDAATRARRKEQLLEIVKTVAGSDVSVRFEDQYLKGVRQADWGGDGKETVLKAGFYRLREDLMVIRGIAAGSESELVQTAYHESFHRLQYLALGEKEAKVMDSLWARMKIAIGSNHVEGRPGTGKPIAYSESQAVAFQRYAEARQNGQDPVVAMLGGYEPGTSSLTKWTAHIVAAFDRIIDVGEKLYNRLALGTFDSAKGIFERARTGALAQATEYAFEEPGSGLIRMTASDGWRRRSWDSRAIPTKADITRAERQIAEIDQQMADIRRKAEQEGC